MKKIIYQIISIIILSIILSFVSVLFHTPAKELLFSSNYVIDNDIVELAEAKKIIIGGSALWIDTRPERYYNESHLPGSINIPLPGPIKYRQEIFEKWDKGTFIIVYCSSISCPIANNLAAEMRFMGFTNVKVFVGGFEEWSSGGLPLEKVEGPIQ